MADVYSIASRRRNCLRLSLLVLLQATAVLSQTLPLPTRITNAFSGEEFTNLVSYAGRDDRENWILAQIISGNVPGWLRTLKPINTSIAGHTGTYHVTPDYLAVGSDSDYFLTPMTPILGQRLATQLGCNLPTRRMVNQTWTNAAVKMNPQSIVPSGEMTTVPVFAWHNYMVRTQRNFTTNAFPLSALVSGNKKDVIISNEITNRPPPPRVIIYGWHYQNGVPIQDLSATHEETYVDYSHGIRLVQSAMTVDGASGNVSNVLQSSTLNGLLSDEGRIPLPFYSVAAMSPVILSHPASRSAYAGESVMLETVAAGDPPLTFRWRRNGVTLPGFTNASMTIPNALASDAGNYSVTVSNQSGVATSRVASVRVLTNSFPTVFRDDFETNSAAQWDVFWASGDSVADYTAQFAFDHRSAPFLFNGLVAPIPSAPHSALHSSRALRLTVNGNDATGATAAVCLYPKFVSMSGNFALKFDLWINYPGLIGGSSSTGSTQHALFGLNHLGTNVNWAPVSATASDGLWFAMAGEGGISTDYRAYQGNLAGTQIDLTGTLTASNSTAALYQNLFPTGTFETPGAPGKRWVSVELRQTNNVLAWIMDGTVITLRSNSSAFTTGKIMIGLMDVFPSIANPGRDSFALVDNVRVENLSPPAIQFQTPTLVGAGGMSLSLTSAPNDVLWLESSTNLLQWNTESLLRTTNGIATWLDAGGTPSKFFRARR